MPIRCFDIEGGGVRASFGRDVSTTLIRSTGLGDNKRHGTYRAFDTNKKNDLPVLLDTVESRHPIPTYLLYAELRMKTRLLQGRKARP